MKLRVVYYYTTLFCCKNTPIYHDVEKVTVFVGAVEMATTKTIIGIL